MDEFVFVHNWFKKYFFPLGERYHTFKTALNLLRQTHTKGVPFILETGCVRLKDDWGAGMSTFLFAEYASRYGGHIISVDISEENCNVAREITKDYEELIAIIPDDSIHFLDESVKYLKESSQKVDLLYLDSFDYPYGDLLNHYGAEIDLGSATALLTAESESAIIEKHNDLIGPSQEHCLKEIQAAMPLLHDRSIVLMDDNSLPGGGKPRLAKRWLAEQGWTCLIDSQQTLWIKR